MGPVRLTAGRPVRLALVGAGHAHLHVLARAGRLRRAGVEPVLIAPSVFDYSGLASAVLSGAMDPAEARVDVAALAARHGVPHRATEAAAVDLAAGGVRLADGADEPFDAVSLNVGSLVRDPLGLAARPDTWAAKPLAGLLGLRDRLAAMLADEGECPPVAVAGGGPSGFEIAAALAGLVERRGLRPRIELLAPQPLDWAPAPALAWLRARLAARGVEVLEASVAERTSGACRLDDGRLRPCRLMVMATGLEAPPLVRDLGLPVDGDGRLLLDRSLRSVADPRVFAAGDCGVLVEAPRPPAGVFGVRAAPILLANLAALGEGRPPRAYRPQRRWLSILDLGDGTGLAVRGRQWRAGRAVLWLKRRLDLGFVRAARA